MKGRVLIDRTGRSGKRYEGFSYCIQNGRRGCINIGLKNWGCHFVKKDKGNYLFLFYPHQKKEGYKEGEIGM